MITPTAEARPVAAETPQRVKLKHAATEFESVLLASWLEQLRQSYSLDEEQTELAGGDNMMSLATQAVAEAMAARGGIGIAQLISQRFER